MSRLDQQALDRIDLSVRVIVGPIMDAVTPILNVAAALFSSAMMIVLTYTSPSPLLYAVFTTVAMLSVATIGIAFHYWPEREARAWLQTARSAMREVAAHPPSLKRHLERIGRMRLLLLPKTRRLLEAVEEEAEAYFIMARLIGIPDDEAAYSDWFARQSVEARMRQSGISWD